MALGLTLDCLRLAFDFPVGGFRPQPHRFVRRSMDPGDWPIFFPWIQEQVLDLQTG